MNILLIKYINPLLNLIKLAVLEPFQNIEIEDLRNQARVFSGVLFLILILQVVTILDNFPDLSYSYIWGIAVNFIAYLLSRSRYFREGALLWGISNSSVTLSMIYFNQDFTGLYFLIFNILIMALVSTPPYIIFLTLLNIFMIIILHRLLFNTFVMEKEFQNSIIFNLGVGTIVSGILFYRSYLENIRETIIQKNERQIRLLMSSTAEAIYGIDPDGRCNFINPACVKILNFKSDNELLGKKMHDLLHPVNSDGSRNEEYLCLLHGQKHFSEKVHLSNSILKKSNGEIFNAEIWGNPIYHKGRLIGRIITFMDVSEKINADHKLRNSLKEKEILLKEIHHRVKNNLQVIASLLYLQSERISDDNTQTHLKATRERINSLIIVHEQLYLSEDFSFINFHNYLIKLCSHIMEEHNAGDITIKINSLDFHPSIETAVPCAMIANEIIQNSVQHAFTDFRGSEKIIEISFAPENGYINAYFSDNGKGIQNGMDPDQTDLKMGLFLINIMTEQLGGTVTLKKEKGTEYSIRFPDA